MHDGVILEQLKKTRGYPIECVRRYQPEGRRGYNCGMLHEGRSDFEGLTHSATREVICCYIDTSGR